MRSRNILRLFGQVTISVIAAAYAVKEGIPYIGLSPLPWWRSALRWPQVKVYAVVGNSLAVEFGLFVVYSLIVFLIIQYLLVKPVFGNRVN